MSSTDVLALKVWPLTVAAVCGWFAVIAPPPPFFDGFATSVHPVERSVFALASVLSVWSVLRHDARIWALGAVSAAFWGRAVSIILVGVPGFDAGHNLVAVGNWVALFLASVTIHLLSIPRAGDRGHR